MWLRVYLSRSVTCVAKSQCTFFFFFLLSLTKALKHSDNIFDASPQVVSVLVGPITVYKACYIFAKLKRNFSSRPALIYSFGKP